MITSSLRRAAEQISSPGHARLRALANHWHASKPNSDQAIVVDATEPQVRSIGAGLASFLARALEHTQCAVVPVIFCSATRSKLGQDFLAAIETGCCRDYSDDGEPDTRQFWHEVERCQYEVLPEPAPGPDRGPRRAHPLGRLGVPRRSLP